MNERAALRRLSKRQWERRIEPIGSPEGHVRGWHGGCPSRKPWAKGSSYNALFLDEYGRICCNECGAVDLEVTRD